MNIDNLKGQFRDYARSNFFRIRFNVPDTGGNKTSSPSLLEQIKGAVADLFTVPQASRDDMIDFAIKSSSFPAIGMKETQLEWRGFNVPVTTAVDLGEFTISFLCDSEMVVYQFFVDWMQKMAHPTNGKTAIAASLAANSATIYQVKNDMTFNNSYYIELTHVYPTTVGAIELSEEEGVMEFQVSFKYSTIKNEKLTTSARRAEESLLDKAKSAIRGSLPF